MAVELQDARRLLAEASRELLSKPNVVATGIGYKTSSGKTTPELSLICSVHTKKTKSSLKSKDLIPPTIQNIPTDVNPTGIIHALQGHTDRHRPAIGGISIGHVNITAGTFGCLVKKDGELFILSNNHVLANSNNAEVGDTILQPGPYDGGQNPSDKIAELNDFVPITFVTGGNGDDNGCPIANAAASVLNALAFLVGSKSRLVTTKKPQALDNLVDCAIAKPVSSDIVKNEILEIGTISGIEEGTLGMSLKKSGRTTGLTTGSITQIDVTVQVNYGSNKIAVFTDQLMAGAMSQGGDSGSAVLNDANNLVGLLFAGSTTTTIINRIQNVFDSMNVTLP